MKKHTESPYESSKVSYKPSGIEWLGEIPHHWEVRRVATLGKFFKGSNISKNDLQDSGVSVVLYGDIYTKYEIKTKQFQSKIAENFAKDKTQILCGDLLFSGSGETKEDIGKCICYLGNEKAYVGGDVIVLRQMGQDSLFLSYVLNSDYIKYQKAVISKGEIIIHIYASNLRDLKIPLPPLQEQKEIAEFLDKKCEKIQNYINKKQKLITLLQEKKQALINEAVCGRVACHTERSEVSTTAYKPSGIEWLGEIPQGWEIKKAKGIFKEVKRSVEDNDEIITCFRDGVVTLRKNRRTEGFTNSLKEIGYQGIRVNDLVIHSMDAFAGAIGVSDSNGKATPVYVVCVPRYDDLVDNKYYAYLLRNMANSGFILSLAKGIRERSTEFKYNDFADLKIPLPPLQEQKEIAAFLDSKVAQIDSVIEKTKRQIELIKEYKNTLINEAVCGRMQLDKGRG